jgi:hypothetical protein
MPTFVHDPFAQEIEDVGYYKACGCSPDDQTAVLAKKLMWGTYGKSDVPGQLGPGPLRWVRFIDCSTDHLKTILKTQPIDERRRQVVEWITKEATVHLTPSGARSPSRPLKTTLRMSKQPWPG